MCWNGNPDDLRIAKRNIKVKKILYKKKDSSIESPFQFSVYKVGEAYKAKLKEEHINMTSCIYIDEGLHCFSKKCPCFVERYASHNSLYIGKKTNIMRRILHKRKHCYRRNIGIFSTDRPFSLNNPAAILIGIFIIPKGTKYYENEYGEIVTEKYIFKDYKVVK